MPAASALLHAGLLREPVALLCCFTCRRLSSCLSISSTCSCRRIRQSSVELLGDLLFKVGWPSVLCLFSIACYIYSATRTRAFLTVEVAGTTGRTQQDAHSKEQDLHTCKQSLRSSHPPVSFNCRWRALPAASSRTCTATRNAISHSWWFCAPQTLQVAGTTGRIQQDLHNEEEEGISAEAHGQAIVEALGLEK